MYPENPEGTQVIQVIVGSMNMGYISDTARNRTHNLLPGLVGWNNLSTTLKDYTLTFTAFKKLLKTELFMSM